MADDADDLAARIATAKQLLADVRAILRRDDRAQVEARRRWARTHYERNRDEILERQRAQQAEQRATDPDGYRARARARNQRWRESHRDEINAKQREKYWANQEKERRRRQIFYAANAERLRSERRSRYATNPDAANASSRAWREREARRREAGLPTERRRRTSSQERLDNAAAADAFFVREWAESEIDAVRQSAATPPELWDAWTRDCLRARAAHHLAEQTIELARLNLALTRRNIDPAGPTQSARALENERLDAIAAVVNAQLRRPATLRRQPPPDPKAPHRLPPSPSSNGPHR